MDTSNVSSTSPLQALLAGQVPTASSLAAAQASPAVQAQSLLASSDSVLFSSLAGSGSTLPDLSNLTATAQAYSLYTNPALLQQLASGAGSSAASVRTAAVVAPPVYAFNPFDEASWWSDPSASLGSTVDATA